jgi:hypothetical protein
VPSHFSQRPSLSINKRTSEKMALLGGRSEVRPYNIPGPPEDRDSKTTVFDVARQVASPRRPHQSARREA